MKWLVSATVVSVLVLGANRSVWDLGDRVSVYPGYFTGNKFRERTHEEKHFYALGYYDAMMSAALFGAPQPLASEIHDCMAGMNSLQVLAIVEKYLDDHPENWHLSMNILIFYAFRDVCQDNPQIDSEN